MSIKTGFDPERDILEKQFGDTRLVLLTDAYIEIEGDNVFSPATKEEWSGRIGHGESGSYIIPVRSLLIDDGESKILVDTGFGENYESDREVSLSLCLEKMNIPSSSIDHVILTHLHGDHFLGNTVQTPAGWNARFPNAVYYAPSLDVADLNGEEQILFDTRFKPIADTGKLVLMDEGISITSTISTVSTAGHTAGHMCVRVSANGKTALFLGDLALHRLNLEQPEWGPNWAWSREQDTKNRKIVANEAKNTGELIIAGHDPDEPWFFLQADGADVRAVPSH